MDKRVKATGLAPEFYRPAQVAALMGTTRQRIYAAVRQERIPCTIISDRNWCIPKAWVHAQIGRQAG